MIMGMCRVGRNILDDVFSLSSEYPPHIPRYHPTLGEMKCGKAKLLSGQVFGFVVNGSYFSLNQVFGMVVWQGKSLSSRLAAGR